MIRRSSAFAIAVTFYLWAFPAEAVTMRYALIIGNNIGAAEDGKEPFPPLLHAEREAERLQKQLVEVSNFDSSPTRTKLLLNADRKQVLEAFDALAAQRLNDDRRFSDVESIFLLYYTGHGLSGRLLLTDGPLSAKELTGLFNKVGADFSVGVFDACYSGSLDSLLNEKGIRPTRGLNLAKEMPEQVLSAKGSVWYVSSGAGQPSYEDKNLGGVFTHFFIEALNRADSDGPGITLDRIWEYARKKTINYTMKYNRRQIPEQFVAKLRSQAPIYFSFPGQASATLVLSESLQGSFALSYAGGQLVKFIDKSAGTKKNVLVYPGQIDFYIFDPVTGTDHSTLKVRENDTLVIHPLPQAPPPVEIGQKTERLFAKGIGLDSSVTATAIRPGASLILGAGYEATFASYRMLHPRHRIFIPLRIDTPHWFTAVNLQFGVDSRRYPGLSYSAFLVGGGVDGGRRIVFKNLDLNTGLAMSAGYLRQNYRDTGDPKKNGGEIYIKGVVGMIFPKKGKWFFEISGQFGPLYAPGAAENSIQSWHVAGGLSLSAYMRVN